jgi:hypothetical protein
MLLLVLKPSARQQTALWQIALENFLPTVKVDIYNGSSSIVINNDPCKPRQFQRHNLSEHEWIVPLLKFVMEHEGGHHESSCLYGHGFALGLLYVFEDCPCWYDNSASEQLSMESLIVLLLSTETSIWFELSFFTNKANCPNLSEWEAIGVCFCWGHWLKG